MLKGLTIIIIIAAFMGGLSIGMFYNFNLGMTNEKLDEILFEIKKNTISTEQMVQPNTPQTIMVSTNDDPVKGNPNAPITIIEFSDFQCPFCATFFDQTLPQIQKEYIDTSKVNFVYRDFPLDGLHPNARAAHLAAECADEQTKFWEFHDLLFKRQAQWADLSVADANDEFRQFASEERLDLNAFDSCLKSASLADEVNEDYLDGVGYGVTGTPTFFIGNDKDGYVEVGGAQPFEVFKQYIDQQLEQ